jgi:M6 family metalloprotease-like protein
LSAAWIDNLPSQITQPDGTVIGILLSGDEFHNWAHDANEYTIIQDPVTGHWCWAVYSTTRSGDVESSGYPIHLYTPQSLGLEPRINISNERYLERKASFEIEINSRSSRAPSIGVINAVVIFIRFADQNEFTATLTSYDNTFNNQNSGANSLYRYFYDASYQQLEIHSHFFPIPPGATMISYQDPFPRNYYLQYNATTNPNGYQPNQSGSRRRALLTNAINYVRDQIPADLNLDYDGDGTIDNIIFMVRGASGPWAHLLWSHMSSLWSENIIINGARVGTYNFNMEDYYNNDSVGGTALVVHEFGHSLGSPDFYRYNNNTITPVGFLEVMSNQTNPPQSMSMFTKWRYMRWIPEIPEITDSGVYTLFPNSTHIENSAYRIRSPFSVTEYFVLEYRNRNVSFTDFTLPSSGLVVYRVNTLAGWGNSQGPPDELYAYRFGGTLHINGNLSTAFFSAENQMTFINDVSNPSSFLSTGAAGGLNIYNIGSAGDSISFFVDVCGADPENINESFENGNFLSFDWQNDSINPWSITDAEYSHGSHSAVSGIIETNQSSRLDIDMNIDIGWLQFFVKTSTNSSGGFLRFYVDNALINSWSGNTDWTRFSVFLMPGIYRFSWVYEKNNQEPAGEDRVWIDQIGFPPIKGHILYPPRNLSHSLDDRDITLTWEKPFQTTVTISTPPVLTGYKLFQNNVLLTTTTETSHFIPKSAGGRLVYRVSALYEDTESNSTDTINLDIPLAIPSRLTAVIEGSSVRLNWEFEYNTQTLAGFRILRNNQLLTTALIPKDDRSYLDSTVQGNQEYKYNIRAVFANPSGTSANSNDAFIEVELNDSDTVEPAFITALHNNYPNPFNPQTIIRFSIENMGNVRINVYNVRGQQIRTLTNGMYGVGSHVVIWDGTDDYERSVGSGVYFYKMTTDEFSAVRKMILLK